MHKPVYRYIYDHIIDCVVFPFKQKVILVVVYFDIRNVHSRLVEIIAVVLKKEVKKSKKSTNGQLDTLTLQNRGQRSSPEHSALMSSKFKKYI